MMNDPIAAAIAQTRIADQYATDAAGKDNKAPPTVWHLQNMHIRDRLLEAIDKYGLKPMSIAPKDRPILAYCDHEADPYHEGESLTLYAAHAEGMDHAPTGFHIIEWGGAFDDSSHEEPNAAHLPDWWFVVGSEFEKAANPIAWTDLPEVPKKEK